MKNTSKILLVIVLFFQLVSYAEIDPPQDSIKLIKKNNATFIYLFKNLNFSFNKTKIDENCHRQLYLIAYYLKQRPNLKIEIGVHNSFRNPKDLSQVRAEVLKDFLVKNGVYENNIRAVGYNTSEYINHCQLRNSCTAKQNLVNRRIEIKILNPEVLEEFIVISK